MISALGLTFEWNYVANVASKSNLVKCVQTWFGKIYSEISIDVNRSISKASTRCLDYIYCQKIYKVAKTSSLSWDHLNSYFWTLSLYRSKCDSSKNQIHQTFGVSLKVVGGVHYEVLKSILSLYLVNKDTTRLCVYYSMNLSCQVLILDQILSE